MSTQTDEEEDDEDAGDDVVDREVVIGSRNGDAVWDVGLMSG
jgi:hypothetical protein